MPSPFFRNRNWSLLTMSARRVVWQLQLHPAWTTVLVIGAGAGAGVAGEWGFVAVLVLFAVPGLFRVIRNRCNRSTPLVTDYVDNVGGDRVRHRRKRCSFREGGSNSNDNGNGHRNPPENVLLRPTGKFLEPFRMTWAFAARSARTCLVSAGCLLLRWGGVDRNAVVRFQSNNNDIDGKADDVSSTTALPSPTACSSSSSSCGSLQPPSLSAASQDTTNTTASSPGSAVSDDNDDSKNNTNGNKDDKEKTTALQTTGSGAAAAATASVSFSEHSNGSIKTVEYRYDPSDRPACSSVNVKASLTPPRPPQHHHQQQPARRDTGRGNETAMTTTAGTATMAPTESILVPTPDQIRRRRRRMLQTRKKTPFKQPPPSRRLQGTPPLPQSCGGGSSSSDGLAPSPNSNRSSSNKENQQRQESPTHRIALPMKKHRKVSPGRGSVSFVDDSNGSNWSITFGLADDVSGTENGDVSAGTSPPTTGSGGISKQHQKRLSLLLAEPLRKRRLLQQRETTTRSVPVSTSSPGSGTRSTTASFRPRTVFRVTPHPSRKRNTGVNGREGTAFSRAVGKSKGGNNVFLKQTPYTKVMERTPPPRLSPMTAFHASSPSLIQPVGSLLGNPRPVQTFATPPTTATVQPSFHFGSTAALTPPPGTVVNPPLQQKQQQPVPPTFFQQTLLAHMQNPSPPGASTLLGGSAGPPATNAEYRAGTIPSKERFSPSSTCPVNVSPFHDAASQFAARSAAASSPPRYTEGTVTVSSSVTKRRGGAGAGGLRSRSYRSGGGYSGVLFRKPQK